MANENRASGRDHVTGTTNAELGAGSLQRAALRSERLRIVLMLAFLGTVGLLGVVRVVKPLDQAPRLGPMILVLAAAFSFYEGLMLLAVRREMSAGKATSRPAWRVNAVVEALFPSLLGSAVVASDPSNSYLTLTSPLYASIFVLILLATLRLDPVLCALSGATGAVGYALLGVYVSSSTPSARAPMPPLAYVLLFLALLVTAAVATYVTHRMRAYVRVAVRELETRRERDRMERDLQVAREVQQNLLPRSMPGLPGYDLAAMNRPADQTGGDYYDWQEIEEGRVVFSLADVTGHGVGPALVTAACRAYVRATMSGPSAAADVLSRVNRLLHVDLLPGKFVTFAMLELDAGRNRAVFLSAGHGPSFVVHGASGDVSSILSQGTPLGLFPELTLQDAVELDLRSGDLIVIFSDGFFEWANPDGEEFGVDRLESLVRAHREASAEELIEELESAIRAFAGESAQPDDMTVLVIKRL